MVIGKQISQQRIYIFLLDQADNPSLRTDLWQTLSTPWIQPVPLASLRLLSSSTTFFQHLERTFTVFAQKLRHLFASQDYELQVLMSTSIAYLVSNYNLSKHLLTCHVL